MKTSDLKTDTSGLKTALKPLRIGIAGLGTVGSGTVNLLNSNRQDIIRRLGCELVVSHVAARRDNVNCDITGVKVSRDVMALLDDSELDVIVELIGGTTTAKALILGAIAKGKHVVTANKALIAEHGAEILAAAQAQHVQVLFEAGVAGGIPILKVLREGLAANQIQWLAGIINGTGNYILTAMLANRDFADVLKEAQAHGYAEADPRFDVEGIDAAHKLTILASLAFGIPLAFDQVYIEGITQLTPMDLLCADELGYRIKHLGIAYRTDYGISLRVHPALIPKTQLLAHVDGVMNAVVVHSNGAGSSLYYGAGAGSLPTASSVVADLMDLARGVQATPPLAFAQLAAVPLLAIEDVEQAFYLRLWVKERPGVLADIATELSHHGISIEAIIQKPMWIEGDRVPIILLTQPVREGNMNDAIVRIQAQTQAEILKIRLLPLA